MSNFRLISVAQITPRFSVLSLFFLCFASGFSLVIRARKIRFSQVFPFCLKMPQIPQPKLLAVCLIVWGLFVCMGFPNSVRVRVGQVAFLTVVHFVHSVRPPLSFAPQRSFAYMRFVCLYGVSKFRVNYFFNRQPLKQTADAPNV